MLSELKTTAPKRLDEEQKFKGQMNSVFAELRQTAPKKIAEEEKYRKKMSNVFSELLTTAPKQIEQTQKFQGQMKNVFSELHQKAPVIENEPKRPPSSSNSETHRTPKNHKLRSPPELEDEKSLSNPARTLNRESPAKQKSPATRGVTKKGSAKDTKSPKGSLQNSLKKPSEYSKEKPEKPAKQENARLYGSGGSSSAGGAKAAP